MENLIISLKEQGNKRLEKVQIEEVKTLFQKYSIPTYLLTDLYNYTDGIRKIY